MTKQQIELINKYIKNNATYQKYLALSPANILTSVELKDIENGIVFLKKHYVILERYIYAVPEQGYYNNPMPVQETYIDILMAYKKLLQRFEIEKRRRLCANEFNSKLLSKQTQYDYIYTDGGTRSTSFRNTPYYKGVSI